ncbi:MAG: hypothetical protein RL681_657 [Candidatus Parcubacteria bacterium]|jgi:hypothetical protein
MTREAFNPENKAYRTAGDLPEERRAEFQDVEGGGFVRKEAAEVEQEARARAQALNKARSVAEKLLGKNTTDATDILHEQAAVEDMARTAEAEEREKKFRSMREFDMREDLTTKILYHDIEANAGTIMAMGSEPLNTIRNAKTGAIDNKLWILQTAGNDVAAVGKMYGALSEDAREFYEWLSGEVTTEQQMLDARDALRKRHPGNSLFNTEFLFSQLTPEEKKKGYVSVYHKTYEKNIDGIAQDGLKLSSEFWGDDKVLPQGEQFQKKVSLDKLFDDHAPEGYRRMSTVFAYPDYRDPESGKAMKAGVGEGVVLEMKIDPKRALVVDVGKHNRVAEELHFEGGDLNDPMFREEAVKAAKSYWESGVTLEEYLAMSYDEQRKRFETPEVLIPENVPPERMRVAAVLGEFHNKEENASEAA